MELTGKVAVVTGSARRIGAVIVQTLAAAGTDVVVNYRHSQADAEATATDAARRGVRAIAVQADLSRPPDVDALLQGTLDRLGRVDILVANASTFRRTPIESITIEDWNDMIDNNLRATFLCGHRFGLWMRAHEGGVIINIADVAGERPWKDYLPYSVAKAGVIALTRSLAKELAPRVRVNAIEPGPMLFPEDYDTAARQREVDRTLLRRAGNPQNIADAVLALVRNDYITGAILPVDGGRGLAT